MENEGLASLKEVMSLVTGIRSRLLQDENFCGRDSFNFQYDSKGLMGQCAQYTPIGES